MIIALSHLIEGAWDNAKKYNGERNIENGIRKSFMVFEETIICFKSDPDSYRDEKRGNRK